MDKNPNATSVKILPNAYVKGEIIQKRLTNLSIDFPLEFCRFDGESTFHFHKLVLLSYFFILEWHGPFTLALDTAKICISLSSLTCLHVGPPLNSWRTGPTADTISR